MSGTSIPIGKPFYFGILEERMDDMLPDFAVDGHPGLFATEEEALSQVVDAVHEYADWGGVVYHCVPVVQVKSKAKVKIDRLAKARGEQ